MKLYFKHSTLCPISGRAKAEVEGFLKQKPENVDYEMIDVIADREYSREIAEKLGVKHESPQVILTGEGDTVLWSASHYSITQEKILEAINTNK